VVKQGDLSADKHAVIIHFDRIEDAFAISRNGSPPPPEEFVPDGDIGGVVRHLVRANSAFGPVYVTVADTLVGSGVEQILNCIVIMVHIHRHVGYIHR
jgi:hypothetical protein